MHHPIRKPIARTAVLRRPEGTWMRPENLVGIALWSGLFAVLLTLSSL